MLNSSRFLPWFIVSFGGMGFFYAFFQRVAPSVMVGELMRDFGVNAAVLGNLSAFYFYAYASVQVPVGVMADRWGPRRVMTGAGILCAIGSLMLSTADTLYAAYAGRLLIGAGSGFFFVSSLKLASVWFPPRRFAFVSGMIMMVGLSGGVGGQAPLAGAVEMFGWRGTMMAGAVAALVLAGLCWFLVRDHPEGEAEKGSKSVTIWVVLSGLRGAMKRRQTWILSGVGAAMSASLLAFGSLWGVPYMMQTYGLSRPGAAASVSLLLIGWAIAAPIIGWASDKVGRRKLPLLITAILALVTICILVYGPLLPLFAANILLFLNGAFSAGMVICFALARENNPAHTAGGSVAVVNMGVMMSGAILQPLVGWLLDRRWTGDMIMGGRIYSVEAYEFAFLCLVGASVLSIILSLLVRETYCRPIDS